MDGREGAAAGASGDRLGELRRGLSPRAERVARAAAQAVLADEDAAGHLVAPPPATVDLAVLWLTRATGNSSTDVRRGFGFLALCLQLLPLFVIGVPRRMTSLTLADRIRYLEALEQSRVGLLAMLVLAFKVPMCIAAFEDGGELRAMGFDRPSTTARRSLAFAPPEPPLAGGEST